MTKAFTSIKEWQDYYFPHGLPDAPPSILTLEEQNDATNLRSILLRFAKAAKVFSADGLPHTKAYAQTVQALQQHFGHSSADNETTRTLLRLASEHLELHATEYDHPGQHGLIRQINDYLEK